MVKVFSGSFCLFETAGPVALLGVNGLSLAIGYHESHFTAGSGLMKKVSPFLPFLSYHLYHRHLRRGQKPNRRPPCSGTPAYVNHGSCRQYITSGVHPIGYLTQKPKGENLTAVRMARELKVKEPGGHEVRSRPVLEEKGKFVSRQPGEKTLFRYRFINSQLNTRWIIDADDGDASAGHCPPTEHDKT